MASWNWPNILNRMLSDIPGLNILLNALLKQDPTGTTDVPSGAKRWTDTADGKQFQVWNGSLWSSVGKLAHDAASVDGKSASTGTTPDTIPVRDKDGALPGDITGNAATATKAEALSAANPVAMGGTGATTVAGARDNLGVPPTDHSSTATTYGAGNATKYGHNKLSDAVGSTLGVNDGTAATPKAVKTVADNAATALRTAVTDLESQIADFEAFPDQTAAEGQSLVSIGGKAAWHPIAQNILDAMGEVVGETAEKTSLSDFKVTTRSYLEKLAGVQAVGTPWYGFDPLSKPAGVQLCSGQEVSRDAYPKHWELVNSGKRKLVTEAEWQAYVAEHGWCPWFSEGDGSTTYRFPLIKGVHPKIVSALAEAGQHIRAGVPNIRGSFAMGKSGNVNNGTLATGAFSVDATTEVPGNNSSSSGATGKFTLDASLSSSVYRDDIDTVQPEAITMVVGEWVVGVAMPIGVSTAETMQASISTLEAQMATTVRTVNGVSADAAGNVALVETVVSGNNWYRKWSDGWVEQGGQTAMQESGADLYTISLPVPMLSNGGYQVKVQTIAAGTNTSTNTPTYNTLMRQIGRPYEVRSTYFKVQIASALYINWRVEGRWKELSA